MLMGTTTLRNRNEFHQAEEAVRRMFEGLVWIDAQQRRRRLREVGRTLPL